MYIYNMGLYRDTGKENGKKYIYIHIMGSYRDNGKENGK